MFKSALRGTSKIVKTCPYCGNLGPKEFIEGEKKVNWVVFTVLFLLTAGVGLIAVPLWYRRNLEAFCDKCSKTIPL
jgi:hypothetical protein